MQAKRSWIKLLGTHPSPITALRSPLRPCDSPILNDTGTARQQERHLAWPPMTSGSDRDILDIAEIVAYYAYVNCIADGLGVSLETWLAN